MIFVFLDRPSLVAMEFADDESVNTVIVICCMKPRLKRKFTMPSHSATPVPIAYSSDSSAEVAMGP